MNGKRFALIIANDQYAEESGLRSLLAPPQDANALAQVLHDPDIGNFEVQMLLNEPSYKVAEAVEGFFTDRKLDDVLLLYFSGHGIKESGQLYFAVANTRVNRLRSTALPAQFINDLMIQSRSRRQLLILDCCYSGAFAKGMVAKDDKRIGTADYFDGRGRAILTASDAMQYSFEEGKVEGQGVRSVFTRFLVEGLKTGAADLNNDGKISLDEMYDYIYDRVIATMPEQRPGKWALDVQGELIVAINTNVDAVLTSSEKKQLTPVFGITPGVSTRREVGNLLKHRQLKQFGSKKSETNKSIMFELGQIGFSNDGSDYTANPFDLISFIEYWGDEPLPLGFSTKMELDQARALAEKYFVWLDYQSFRGLVFSNKQYGAILLEISSRGGRANPLTYKIYGPI